MSILESIKGEKKLSFNHWRFRILHWAFHVKNPDQHYLPNNGLPLFLYTHYCPLFHLTNLIALLSPMILFIRFCVLLTKALCASLAVLDLIPFDKMANFISKIMPKLPEKVKKEKVIQEKTLEEERSLSEQ